MSSVCNPRDVRVGSKDWSRTIRPAGNKNYLVIKYFCSSERVLTCCCMLGCAMLLCRALLFLYLAWIPFGRRRTAHCLTRKWNNCVSFCVTNWITTQKRAKNKVFPLPTSSFLHSSYFMFFSNTLCTLSRGCYHGGKSAFFLWNSIDSFLNLNCPPCLCLFSC